MTNSIKLKSSLNVRQLLLIALLCISIFSMAFYYSRIDTSLQKRYASTSHEIYEQTELLIDEKKEAILLIALSMSRDLKIRESLNWHDPNMLDFTHFTKRFSVHTSLKNLLDYPQSSAIFR